MDVCFILAEPKTDLFTCYLVTRKVFFFFLSYVLNKYEVSHKRATLRIFWFLIVDVEDKLQESDKLLL